MNKNLLILVILSLATSLAQVHSDSIQTSQGRFLSSSSGSVKLYQDNSGYYVYADFKTDASHSDNPLGSYSGSMMLGLTSETTLLINQCNFFNKYNCKLYGCSIGSTEYTYKLPYLDTTGNLATADLYLDYNNWNLKSKALIATSCSTSGSSFYGQNTYGIIAMGLGGDSYKNFIRNQVFSIYLYKGSSGGLLMFNSDLNYAKNMSSEATLPTDANWRTSINGYIDIGSNYTISVNTKVGFDLNAETIGLPTSIFWGIMGKLSSYGIPCKVGAFDVVCSYTGFASDLPTLTIREGVTKIPIVPEIYVKEASSSYVSSITLNLRPTGSNYTSKNYVTSAYDNTILLGSCFMKYYYTVFDNTNSVQTVKLYVAKYGSSNSDGNNAVGVVALIAIFVICAICKCCKNVKVDTVSSTSTTIVANTTQEPLVFHAAAQNTFIPNGGQGTFAPNGGQGTFIPNGAQGTFAPNGGQGAFIPNGKSVHFAQPQGYVNPQPQFFGNNTNN